MASNPQVPPKNGAAGANGSELSGLMREMGSPTGQWDPIPPDQYRWQFAESEPLKHRIWSWLMSHTVARGRRKPYAVDEKGAALSLRRLAADLDVSLHEMLPSFAAGERAGLWKTANDRIYLLALVKPAASESADAHSPEFKTLPPEFLLCTESLPDCIVQKLKDTPLERAREFRNAWVALSELKRAVNAVVLAASREVLRGLEHELMAEYGIEPRRKNGETEEDEAARRERVHPLLPAVEEVVRALRKDCVQSVDVPRTQSSLDSVHSPHPLVSLEVLEVLDARPTNGRAEPPRAADSASPPPSASLDPPARPPAGVVDSQPNENQSQNQTPPSEGEKPGLPSGTAADSLAESAAPAWHGELRRWLEGNCPVPTGLDRRMLARIIGALGRAELLEAFYAAARAVENPRKWAIYEDIARQVAARGEIPHAPPGRAAVKAERAAEFEREMRAKYGDKLKRMREQKNGKPENGR